jgi:hypothetical protein
MNKDLDYYIPIFKKEHGNRYDYSNAIFVNSKTKIDIICPEHGIFSMTPLNHKKHGCKKCASVQRGYNKRLTLDQFSKKANTIHNNKYSYEFVTYKSYNDKVDIVCPKHGIFSQLVKNHLDGAGCPMCASIDIGIANKKPQEEFINKCKSVHNNFYSYEQSEYIGWDKPFSFICPEHGEIKLKKASSHVKGDKCEKCANKKKRFTKNFIQKGI